jgi:alanine dehydrogenase
VLAGTPHAARMVGLGAILSGAMPPRGADEVTLSCSVGLAGTEAFLLDALAPDVGGRAT